MTYAVKEIYYTLQGEGANTGRAAVFLRFAGCNLWTGLERDREKGPGGCSRWCDTDFVGTDGPGGGKFRTAAELLAAVSAQWPKEAPDDVARFVVCTGGEPFLQLDEPLLQAFNAAGWSIAVESNGTLEPPPGKLWLTVSPKANAPLRIEQADEIKLVYPQAGIDPAQFEHMDFQHFFLQPLDGPDAARNRELALQYCLQHPRWRLSLQTHKVLQIR